MTATASCPRQSIGQTAVLLLVLPVVSALCGWLLIEQPLLAALGVLVGGGVALLLYPELATIIFAVILATNAATVAVRFHGAPFIVGAASPLLMGIPILYHAVFRGEGFILPKLTIWILGFQVCAMISTVVSSRPDVSLEFVFTSLTEGMILFLLTINAIRSTRALRRVLWAVVWSGAALGLLSCYQELTHTYADNYGGFAQMDNKGAFETEVRGIAQTQPRLEGPIGDQNFYAQWMLALVPLGVCLALSAKRWWLKCVTWGGTALIAFGVALTFSRGAAVAGVVMLVLFAILFRARRSYLVGGAIGIALLFIVFPQYGTRLSSLTEIWQVVGSTSGIRQTDLSVQGRTTEMLAAGLAYLDHPVCGVGPGMFRYHYGEYANRVGFRVVSEDRAAHCMVLQIAAEMGTFALLCFLAIVGSCLWGLTRTLRHSRDPDLSLIAAALLLSLVGYLTTSLFLDYAFVRFLWFLLALAAVAIRLAVTPDESSRVAIPCAVTAEVTVR